MLLILCKSLAYSISLASFRGGPVFPSIFVGGVAGILFSHLPGLPITAGIAMGIGAMTAVMLRMPMTAVLLASLLLGPAGVIAMPLVIVAVAVAFVASEWLAPSLSVSQEHADGQPKTTRTGGPMGGPVDGLSPRDKSMSHEHQASEQTSPHEAGVI